MQADRPNAYEFRLLLSEEIVRVFEWAFNAFLENEIGGDRGREWGFAQAVQMPFFLPHERFKAGVEMQYKNFTVKDTRGDPLSTASSLARALPINPPPACVSMSRRFLA